MAGRAARKRALLILAFAAASGACSGADRLTSSTDSPGAETAEPIAAPSFSSSFRGGIPFGTFAQPTREFGARFNGAMRNIWPRFLLEELAAIKARGGKVILMLAGMEDHYKDRGGHFDMEKWKERVDRFKGVDFTSFINDGTIIGHYLIDEPYDPYNWRGQPVPGSVVDEMARYSKQLWPGMVTIVRAQPNEVKWNGRFRYLDAAWAQYTYQKGDVESYIRRHVAEAQEMGLALVVGLNITMGSPSKGEMTASQVKESGNTLLSSTYPCAFISWQYRERHLKRDDVAQAMESLAEKAGNRPARSCRGANSQSPDVDPEPPPPDPDPDDDDDDGEDDGDDEPDPPAEPAPPNGAIQLTATNLVESNRHATRLTWTGARSDRIDLYLNGVFMRSKANDGHAISVRLAGARGSFSFRICEAGTTKCSNNATVTIERPAIDLTVSTYTRGRRLYTSLRWSGLVGKTVDVYRNDRLIGRTPNDRSHSIRAARGETGAQYRVCQSGTPHCSSTVTAS